MPIKQQILAMAADQSFDNYRKPTRHNEFLKTMQAIVPWAELCEVIDPYYPKAGNGRPPIGLERMLRIHFVQPWFNLADLACEEALYDSASLRRFVGIDLRRESSQPFAAMPNGKRPRQSRSKTFRGNFPSPLRSACRNHFQNAELTQ